MREIKELIQQHDEITSRLMVALKKYFYIGRFVTCTKGGNYLVEVIDNDGLWGSNPSVTVRNGSTGKEYQVDVYYLGARI